MHLHNSFFYINIQYTILYCRNKHFFSINHFYFIYIISSSLENICKFTQFFILISNNF